MLFRLPPWISMKTNSHSWVIPPHENRRGNVCIIWLPWRRRTNSCFVVNVLYVFFLFSNRFKNLLMEANKYCPFYIIITINFVPFSTFSVSRNVVVYRFTDHRTHFYEVCRFSLNRTIFQNPFCSRYAQIVIEYPVLVIVLTGTISVFLTCWSLYFNFGVVDLDPTKVRKKSY